MNEEDYEEHEMYCTYCGRHTLVEWNEERQDWECVFCGALIDE